MRDGWKLGFGEIFEEEEFAVVTAQLLEERIAFGPPLFEVGSLSGILGSPRKDEVGNLEITFRAGTVGCFRGDFLADSEGSLA